MRRNLGEYNPELLHDELRKKNFKNILDFGELVHIAVTFKLPKHYGCKLTKFLEDAFEILGKKGNNAKNVFKLLIVELCGDFDEISKLGDDKIVAIYDSLKKIKNPKMGTLEKILEVADEYSLSDLQVYLAEIVLVEKEEQKLSAEELLIEQQVDRLDANYNIPKNKLKLFLASVTVSLDESGLEKFVANYKKLKEKLRGTDDRQTKDSI